MFHVCMCVKYNSILYMYNMHILTIADILKYKRKKAKKTVKNVASTFRKTVLED